MATAPSSPYSIRVGTIHHQTYLKQNKSLPDNYLGVIAILHLSSQHPPPLIATTTTTTPYHPVPIS